MGVINKKYSGRSLIDKVIRIKSEGSIIHYNLYCRAKEPGRGTFWHFGGCRETIEGPWKELGRLQREFDIENR